MAEQFPHYIEFRHVYKSFDHPVLIDSNFHVDPGETVAIIGRSGVGKSVTLGNIMGFIKPDSGRVIVAHEDVTDCSETEWRRVRRKVTMVFQSGALFDSLTVAENVGFGILNLRPDLAGHWRDVVNEKLGLVGLDPQIGDLKPAELSGGMKKRVGLARAIAYEPDYILYDEPTTGLDPIMSDVINQLIRSLQKRIGLTSVVVTHDLHSAWTVGDRLALLHEGRVQFTGTPDEAKASSDLLVRQFIEGRSEGPVPAV